MKFLELYFVVMLAWSTPAYAAEYVPEEPEIVVTGDVATMAQVYYESEGVATIEMGPLYGVFLDTVPSDVTPHMKQNDVSGKGIAHVAKWRKTPYKNALICFREVGVNWDNPPSCAEVDGTQVSVMINLHDRRNEVFALVPVAVDVTTKAHIAWVAHPENTQMQLRCGNQEDMASIFAIDGAGVITIATAEERARYQSTYCKK
jgi:hypothetical protein